MLILSAVDKVSSAGYEIFERFKHLGASIGVGGCMTNGKNGQELPNTTLGKAGFLSFSKKHN